MSQVKGSEQYSLVVVRYRRWRAPMLILGVLILLAASVSGSYWLGYRGGLGDQHNAVKERDRLRLVRADLERDNQSLRQQVANLELGSEVDRKAGESVRAEVIALRDEIARLEEDISFYRGLMSPSENEQGLTIGSLNLLQSTIPGGFDYKLVVQQLATRHELLNGVLTFTIAGKRDGTPAKLLLKDVSAEVDSENIKLRFKYFQTIEGRLRLPDNFEPERIELTARTKGNNSETIRKSFGWLVEER